jgi:curved DNA-binding protein CbpA
MILSLEGRVLPRIETVIMYVAYTAYDSDNSRFLDQTKGAQFAVGQFQLQALRPRMWRLPRANDLVNGHASGMASGASIHHRTPMLKKRHPLIKLEGPILFLQTTSAAGAGLC